jgi:diguanylate cyclase (GGDEF)-like protein/PAS domain S-box-containing protein
VADVDVDPSALQRSWLLRNPSLLRPTVYALTAGIFAADFLFPEIVALSMVYTIPILVSLWIGRRYFTITLAVLCSVLTLVGAFAAPGEAIPEDHMRSGLWIVNGAAAIFSIAMVTSLGLMRLKTERELAYVRKLATTTLRSLGEAVVTINGEGEVRFANRVACDLLGRSSEELVGGRASDVFIVRDVQAQRPELLELVEAGAGETREAVLFAIGGKRIPIEYNRTPIQSADGELYGQVIVFRDISVRKEHEDAIKRLAYRDDLTGLPNRVSLVDRLQLELAHAKRNKEQLAVAYVDLDGFKQVNDSHGHAAGDALLKSVAERMRSVLRAGDTIARLGGDEFVIVLPAIGGAEDARRVGEKVIAVLETPFLFEGRPLRASASLGLAMFPRDGGETDMLLRRADKAMYRAKSLGHGKVQVFQNLSDSQWG